MKFKIGDQVAVISIGAGNNGWAPSMNQYLHKTGTIIADYRADPAREFDSLDTAWDERPIRYQVEFQRDGLPDQWWFPEDSLELSNQKRHKHADLIHEWAEGAQIEIKLEGEWVTDVEPDWYLEYEYRIKPKELYWWENIPAHGILIKNDDEKDEDVILHILPKDIDRGVWIYLSDNEYSSVHRWSPLTNQEIEGFKR